MKRQVINILIMLIAVNLNGCAKKVLMKYAEPTAIKACEEDFYSKYYMFLNDEGKKKLGEIKVLQECDGFLNEFWNVRDTDPTTTENEFKNLLEKRATDIENETLFQNTGTVGFSFKSNGNFNGEPAKVYMLHGMPNYTETLKNGISYVDLMLWVYLDEQRNHKYRFFFYQKNSNSIFVLLRPGFDIFYGLEEINKNPAFIHPTDVYNELERNGQYIFLLSMISFSDDSSLSVDKALRPPKPASEIAKNMAPKVIGERPEKEKVVISNNLESSIPAELFYEIIDETLFLKLTIKHENLDWILKNNELIAELIVKVISWSGNHRHEEEQMFDIVSTKEKIVDQKSAFIFYSSPIKLYEQPTRISVYIKNNQKYNSWIEEVQK